MITERSHDAADIGLAPKRRAFSVIRALFLMLVIVPTALTFYYAYTTPAPVYMSQVQFAVEDRSQSQFQIPTNALASMGVLASQPNSLYALRRFLQSHDALIELENDHGFKRFYTPDQGDWLTALSEDANSNTVLRYYNWVLTVHISTTENIMTLEIWAYEPEIAQGIASSLLRISEIFLNRMNARALEDQVAFYRDELILASTELSSARTELARWRNSNDALDPGSQAQMIQQVIGGLEVQLANLRTEIRRMEVSESPDRFRPLIREQKEREASLLAQIEQTRARLTGEQDGAVAALIKGFEELATDVELAQSNVQLLMSALENARQNALQQQKYLVLISSPSLNDAKVFPLVGFHTLFVGVLSLVVFSIAALLYVILRDYQRN